MQPVMRRMSRVRNLRRSRTVREVVVPDWFGLEHNPKVKMPIVSVRSSLTVSFPVEVLFEMRTGFFA